MISINEAKEIVFSGLFEPGIKIVNLLDGLNYFLAKDILADRDYPPFNRAAVDGFAVSAKDLDCGIQEFKIEAIIFSGDNFSYKFNPGECVKIMTGASVPNGLDVLFKVEDCQFTGEYFKYTGQKYNTGMNISNKGENSRKGDVIIRKGSRVDYRTANSLAATGHNRISVYQPPEVAIISTGSEVVSIDTLPEPYQIRDSNYPGLSLALGKFNIKPSKYILVTDERNEIRSALEEGLKSDVLIVSGGVSMGDADFVPVLLEEMGVEKKFHNVNIKPGKPFWFGIKGNKKVFALPGNPLSTLVSYKIFIEPWLLQSLGNSPAEKMFLPLSKERTLKGDRPEFFPVKMIPINEQSYLEPVTFHGSGDITATQGSDGLAFHPIEKKQIFKGDPVEYFIWN
jgi:molybdopterin molybdotransferase